MNWLGAKLDASVGDLRRCRELGVAKESHIIKKQGRAVGEIEGNPRVLAREFAGVGSGHAVTATRYTTLVPEEELPSHLKMGEKEEVGLTFEAKDHELTDAVDVFDSLSRQDLCKILSVAHRLLVKNINFFDAFSDHLMQELEPHRFDFGKFRHMILKPKD